MRPSGAKPGERVHPPQLRVGQRSHVAAKQDQHDRLVGLHDHEARPEEHGGDGYHAGGNSHARAETPGPQCDHDGRQPTATAGEQATALPARWRCSWRGENGLGISGSSVLSLPEERFMAQFGRSRSSRTGVISRQY